MTDAELIARLRDEHVAASRTEAADRIEALIAERDDAERREMVAGDKAVEYLDRAEAAEAKLAKAVEALEAFKEFDDLPTAVKRPDLFELKVRKPILRTLAKIKGESHE